MLLVGDIGGTKTDLALVSPMDGPRAPLLQVRLPSASYPGLEAAARAMLARTTLRPTHACFALAGPITAGRAALTNLDWQVDAAQLRDALGLEAVWLLNDLEATAAAVPLLAPDEIQSLKPGEPVEHGTIAVIAPGTGLGEAFLVWDAAGYRAFPSEGGHTGFAPSNAVEAELLAYLLRRFERVSVERVCSGLGIANLYAFFRDTGYAPESPAFAQQLAAAKDPTPLIVAAALNADSPCPLARRALETFTTILGAEAGDLALTVLATGGVYLAGGIPPRIVDLLRDGTFTAAFVRKGRFEPLLARIPIAVVMIPIALIGAASEGLRRMRGESP